MPRLMPYFYCEKMFVLNVNNLTSQCFHIASSLGPDLRPLKKVLTSLVDFRKTRGAYFSGVSVEHRSQTPELAAPFPQSSKHSTTPGYQFWATIDPKTVLQQNLITLSRHCTIHTHQNSGSQKSLSVPVTLTQPTFHVSLDSFLSPHPTFQEFQWIEGLSEVYGSGSLSQPW